MEKGGKKSGPIYEAAVSRHASVIIVQTLFNEIINEARNLPDFRDAMINFSEELSDHWRVIDEIRREFEKIGGETSLTKSQEKELLNLENRINQLHFEILMRKMDFIHHWLPSFQTHKKSPEFQNFIKLATEAIEGALIPVSAALRTVIQTRSQWVRTRREEKTGTIMRDMTLVFGLVAVIEVLVGYAPIAEESIKNLIIFFTPFILLPIAILISWSFFKLR